jgi:hypothetical protein
MQSAATAIGSGRTAPIIALATQYLGVDRDRLLGRKRDQETVEARQLLCFVLCGAGYTAAAIAWLLDRNHSTILHAICQVEASGPLLDEGQRLATTVLPLTGEEESGGSLRDIPLRAVSRWSLCALPGRAPLCDVRAVRAYVCGTLLWRERAPSSQAAWGLCVLVACPCIRASVEDVLQTCGLPAYCGLIDMLLQRAGVP